MNTKIINVKNFHSSKKDKDYTTLLIMRDITDFEKRQGYLGDVICEEIFVPESQVNSFGQEHIGKEVQLLYSVSGNRAILDTVQLLK